MDDEDLYDDEEWALKQSREESAAAQSEEEAESISLRVETVIGRRSIKAPADQPKDNADDPEYEYYVSRSNV